jgi:DNA-binding phage protein
METMQFDASRYLRNDEERQRFVEDMMKGGTSIEIQNAIADALTNKNTAVSVKDIEALEVGEASFETIISALSDLGLELTVQKKSS